jgi:hypothetical protein
MRLRIVIDHSKEENRVLREQLGGGRLRFTDDDSSLVPRAHRRTGDDGATRLVFLRAGRAGS